MKLIEECRKEYVKGKNFPRGNAISSCIGMIMIGFFGGLVFSTLSSIISFGVSLIVILIFLLSLMFCFIYYLMYYDIHIPLKYYEEHFGSTKLGDKWLEEKNKNV